jgi:hypothetical protein
LLKIAPAAFSEIAAQRRGAHRRRLNDFRNRGKCDFALRTVNAHPRNIARRSQFDQQSASGGVGQAQTAGQDAFDGNGWRGDNGAPRR